jgi:hypothetical protein
MKNPIEQRLDILTGLWNEFAENPEARVLRWLVDADEARIVEAFLAVQEEGGGEVPDLFVRIDAPFERAEQHGFSLIEALRAWYEGERPGLEAAGIDARWAPPAVRPGTMDARAFKQCCDDFQGYYKHLAQNLVIALFPEQVRSLDQWVAWLRKLAALDVSPTVRFMVVDSVAAPVLDALQDAEPTRVVSVAPELDMPGAMMEIARNVPGNHPGNTFRRYFVALTTAAERGDVAAAAEAADRALAIATEQRWPQMQVVVHMAMGGVHLGQSAVDDALGRYRTAAGLADAAAEGGDPAGPKLLLNARLAEGSALIAGGRLDEASQVYEQAAQLAGQQQDHLMTMESWRMAAYCHEAVKRPEPSLRCGLRGLDAAEQLEPEMRKSSTLPFLGAGLLRVAEQIRGAKDRELRHRMDVLAGSGWEQSVPEAPAP